MSLGCTCLVSGSSFGKKPLKPPLVLTGLTMMLNQEALKQHWENVRDKAATLLGSGKSWVEGGARLDGEVGVGTQRMLKSAQHTPT